MRKKLFFIVLVFGITLFPSCQQVKQSILDTFKSDEELKKIKGYTEAQQNNPEILKPQDLSEIPEPKVENFLLDSAYLADAQMKLRNLPTLKDRVIYYYASIHFYADGRINITIQDPLRKENLDEYSYKVGEWLAPTPVRSPAEQHFSHQLFPLSELKFSSVSKLLKEIEGKRKEIAGASIPTHVYLLPSDVPEWRTSISGDRKEYSIRAQLDVKKIDYQRN